MLDSGGKRKSILYESPQGRRINALASMVITAAIAVPVWVTRTWTFHAADLVFFLNEALPHSSPFRMVVLESAPLHRNRVVRGVRRRLREHGIVLYYMPSYCPELTAIEPHLGVVKHHEMPERTCRTLPALSDAIDHAFAMVEARLISNRTRELCPCALH